MTLMHVPVTDIAPYRSGDRVAARPQRVDAIKHAAGGRVHDRSLSSASSSV
jgi:hypothetical protein